MIRILIVDDSAFMRKALTMMLTESKEIEVIDTARDGEEAIEKVKRLHPDLVTMDIEMPRMDGITALKYIMKEAPCPVMMISSLTKEGAQATIEALSAGAVDFIPKQMSFVSVEFTQIKEELIAKIKSIVLSRRSALSSLSRASNPRRTPVDTSRPRIAPAKARTERSSSVEVAPSLAYRRARLIAIGISTGGPAALQEVIPTLPGNLHVPVVVVQHMPPHFTKSLAARLDGMSQLEVVEAEDGMAVEAGRVIIARGGRHLTFRTAMNQTVLTTPEMPETLHRPSVDVMFESASKVYRGRVLATVMTGMGHDGREGARAIKKMGGKVIAQDASSCVVNGMPRSIVEANLADAVLPLDQIGHALARAVSGTSHSPPLNSTTNAMRHPMHLRSK